MFCPHCGREVSEDAVFCSHCGARVREEEAGPVAPPASQAEVREKTPWEDREARGFFRGLFGTLNVLFRPAEFFEKMPVAGGLTDPLLYALILGMTGLMFSYFWQIVSKGALQNAIPAAYGPYMLQGTSLAVLAFLSPFLVIIGVFATAGLLHLCLLLVKGANAGFEATFRVVSYGYSANIFMVVPFCGGLLAFVWAIVLYVIGLREAHGTSGGRAAFAVFFPAIACCGAVIFLLGLLMSMAAVSFGSLIRQMQ